MNDEFYLPEETVEWIAQKKSELLAWVLQNQAEGDIPFEEHLDFTEKLPEVLAAPDEAWAQQWDGHNITIQLKMFDDDGIYWIFVVGLLSPVMDAPGDAPVLVPILSIPTWETKWLRPWLKGSPVGSNPVH